MDLFTVASFGFLWTSYYGSTSIICEGVRDGIKDVKGIKYYFDYKSFIKDRIKNMNFKGLGSLLPLTVPLVNLFYAPLLADEIRENISEVRKYIKPKVFLEEIVKKEEEKENIEIPLKRVFINDKALEGKYTIDEVARLNDTTGYLYKVGTINDEYVAIIGNYNQDKNEDHTTQIVEFLFEEDIKEYDFQPANERDERLKNKLFTVYSLTRNEKLEECIKDINLKRVRKEKEELEKLKEELTTNKTEKCKVIIKK